MKTWQMIKKLTEDVDREFIREDGLIISTSIDDTLLWERGYSHINLHDGWEEVKKPVDFITAVASGSRIRVEHDLVQEDPYYLLNYFCAMDEVVADLTEYFSEDIREIIINGKWYIED